MDREDLVNVGRLSFDFFLGLQAISLFSVSHGQGNPVIIPLILATKSISMQQFLHWN